MNAVCEQLNGACYFIRQMTVIMKAIDDINNANLHFDIEGVSRS